MKMPLFNFVLILLVCVSSAINRVHATSIEISDDKKIRQIVTCENENFSFWALSMMTRFTPYKSISQLSGGEHIGFETLDGVKLSGIKLASETPSSTYILIIQGNAFPAGRVIQEFERFQKKGIDVYAFDFRGYKKSQGKRRIWAMLQDYTEILDWLNSNYDKRVIYATSFGGVIAANVIEKNYPDYNLIIFDSVVSRASTLVKCEYNYDPVDKIPESCENLVVQANNKDRFYLKGNLKELMDSAKQCGGSSIVQPNLAHPFEGSKEAISIRMRKLEELVESRL